MQYDELNNACKEITGKFLDDFGAVTALSKELGVPRGTINRAKNEGRKNTILFAYIRYVVESTKAARALSEKLQFVARVVKNDPYP